MIETLMRIFEAVVVSLIAHGVQADDLRRVVSDAEVKAAHDARKKLEDEKFGPKE